MALGATNDWNTLLSASVKSARSHCSAVTILLHVTWPSRRAAALVSLEAVKLADASVAARWADAGVVDGRQAAAVGVALPAGAAEVHRVVPEHSLTRVAVRAWLAGARVEELALASYVSVPAPGERRTDSSGKVWGVRMLHRWDG